MVFERTKCDGASDGGRSQNLVTLPSLEAEGRPSITLDAVTRVV